jgi:uncharacterized protein DUF1524
MKGYLRRGATATATIAMAAVTWLHPGIGDRDIAAAHAAPASGDLPTLLTQVQVVDDIAAVPGYQRGCKKDQACSFGPAWNDPLDSSGCDTRNRLLAVSLQGVAFKPGTDDCKVAAGTLNPDPYTGETIDLHQVQIDHLYPLKAAWDAGASTWDPRQRQIFANDMTELIAVSGIANEQKGDSTPAEWLPANPAEKCPYVLRYLIVAVKYQLPITANDRQAATGACQPGG